ncbi:MAG: SPFH domain-containing protein, partial [Actinomycetota bacterium]|nr:SPFH domain-containing protein [Actinomycetota bacterium]
MNDANGNPIEIGAVVVWRVVDVAKAVFGVENFTNY